MLQLIATALLQIATLSGTPTTEAATAAPATQTTNSQTPIGNEGWGNGVTNAPIGNEGWGNGAI